MLSEREAAFSVHQLGKTALDLGLKGVTVDHVERRIEQLVGRGQLIAGEARIGDTRPRLVTTQEALRTEERILDAVQEGRARLARPRPQDAPHRLQAAADRELNAGQLGAAALILSSNDRTVVIQGIAGAGKSTMLQAVARVAQAEGRAVTGLAFQNKMVADLAEGRASSPRRSPRSSSPTSATFRPGPRIRRSPRRARRLDAHRR
jgi:hypothetical protein